MGDINDWAAFIRGRWEWERYGYQDGFPRNCQFTDIDAAIEFDGKRLVIEPKHHDGLGPMTRPPDGQLMFLRNEARLGSAVIVLYGCGCCNSPQGIRTIAPERNADDWFDWRGLDIEERRKLLKAEIDKALGIA